MKISKEVSDFWSFEHKGHLFDAVFESEDEAADYAHSVFLEYCAHPCVEPDEYGIFEEEIELIQFFYNNDGKQIIQRISKTFKENLSIN